MANFQTALDALKRGERVARKGWKNGFLFLACGLDFYTTADLSGVYEKVGGQCDGKSDPTWHYDCGPAWEREAICFCPNNSKRGELSVGWLPKYNDLFANDWYVIDDKPYPTTAEMKEYVDEKTEEKKEEYVAPEVKVKEENPAKKDGFRSFVSFGPLSGKEKEEWERIKNSIMGAVIACLGAS